MLWLRLSGRRARPYRVPVPCPGWWCPVVGPEPVRSAAGPPLPLAVLASACSAPSRRWRGLDSLPGRGGPLCYRRGSFVRYAFLRPGPTPPLPWLIPPICRLPGQHVRPGPVAVGTECRRTGRQKVRLAQGRARLLGVAARPCHRRPCRCALAGRLQAAARSCRLIRWRLSWKGLAIVLSALSW